MYIPEKTPYYEISTLGGKKSIALGAYPGHGCPIHLWLSTLAMASSRQACCGKSTEKDNGKAFLTLEFGITNKILTIKRGICAHCIFQLKMVMVIFLTSDHNFSPKSVF